MQIPDQITDVPAEIQAPDPPEPGEAINLIVAKLYSWATAAIETLPNIVMAILVMVVVGLLAMVVRRLFAKALARTPLAPPIQKLCVTSAGLVILGAGLMVALGVLGLEKTVTSLLAGVGIIGLALGFAFQDVAANFMAGIMLSLRRPIRVGEVVETHDFFGSVEEINLRSTIVRKTTGQLVFIPNKEVFENPIVNYSRSGKSRVDLACGVAYGDDLEKARRVAVEAVDGIDGRDREKDVEFFYTEFGNSSINFVVRFWIPFRRRADYLAAQSEAILRVKRAFDAEGITIPFPIRTLDFGVVGGERLDEHLRDLRSAGEVG